MEREISAFSQNPPQALLFGAVRNPISLALHGEDEKSLHVSWWDLPTASGDGRAPWQTILALENSHVLLSCDCLGTPTCLTL